jgi:hypothetical protein
VTDKTTAERKKERKRQLFERHFHSDERVRFMRSLPCEVTGRLMDSHNAHTKSRGSGGTYKDVVPLSFLVHKDYDEMPATWFQHKYKRTKESVRERAAHYQKLWETRYDDD